MAQTEPDAAASDSPADAAAVVAARQARVPGWQRQIVAALVAQLGGVLTMALIVALGHADATAVLVWAPLSMLLSLATLIGLKQGWTLHLRDPVLTEQQVSWSIGSAVCCYAIAGPLRGVALPMTCLALIFSIFALPARTVRAITAGTLAAFALTMAGMAAWQPQRYPPLEELCTFLTLLLSLPPMALLAGRMSELRGRLGRQHRELSQALQRIQALAAQDELTGLNNRRHMQQTLQRACDVAAPQRPFAVALVDLDHFKQVNDRHGHAVGDRVLRHFASVALAALRAGDSIGRWGGEEFVVLLDAS